MAEHVQAALDDMVAPLRDLLDRGIFSQTEVQQIVERRRASEYLLRRRAARKADFLRYLQDEQALEKLRQLRTKKALAGQDRREASTKKKARNKSGGVPLGDVHVVQHIHLLFIRTLRKFRSDVDLHLQHAAFAKETKSNHKLTTIYTAALQVHPRHVGLWIQAASHEFFGGGSISAARILFQRALRVNPKAEELWIQYFCLELHHVQKMRGRREILQIGDKGQGGADNKASAEAAIAKIVYNNGIKEIPDSVLFRLGFLDTLSLFPQTELLEHHIEETLKRDFQDKPESWIARAAHAARKQEEAEDVKSQKEADAVGFVIDTVGGSSEPPKAKKPRTSSAGDDDDDALKVLSEALVELPTSEMYVRTIQFARDYLEQHAWKELQVTSFLEKLFVKARDDENDVVDAALALEQADYLASNGKLDTAIHILKDYYVARGKEVETSVLLLLVKLLKVDNKDEEAIQELTKGLERTPIHDAEYMKILLELFGAKLATKSDGVKPLFEKILLLAHSGSPVFDSSYGVGSAAQACLMYLIDCQVVTAEADSCQDAKVKEAVSMLFERSTYCESGKDKSQEELLAMIQVFEEAIKATSKLGKTIQRRLYEKAMSFFDGWAQEVADTFRDQRDDFLYA